MSENVHIVAGNCLFVKGYSKNLLLDLQKQEWYHIDFEIGVNDIVNLNELEDEIRTHLIENQIVLEVPKDISNLFPKISYDFDIPSMIESAIIDRNEGSIYLLSPVLDWLEKLCTKFYQIRYYDLPDIAEIENILIKTETSIVESIDFILPYSSDLEIYLSDKLKSYAKINSITFHSCLDKAKESNIKIRYSTQIIDSDSCCGIIHPSLFSNNRQHVLKSINYNSCLYKKIGIDTKGNIKNCPSMTKVLGSVESINSLNIKDLETEYWHIKKDQIDICRDCEFRYICTDCRVRVENGIYSRPSTCPYNPYTNKWVGQVGYENPSITQLK